MAWSELLPGQFLWLLVLADSVSDRRSENTIAGHRQIWNRQLTLHWINDLQVGELGGNDYDIVSWHCMRLTICEWDSWTSQPSVGVRSEMITVTRIWDGRQTNCSRYQCYDVDIWDDRMLRIPSSVVKRLPGGLSCWRGPNDEYAFSVKRLLGGLNFCRYMH